MLADQIIRSGGADVIVAGGQESMSQAPYLLRQARTGYRMGDGVIVDAMVYDGLSNAYDGQHMGHLAELCAREYEISREMQDEFAAMSYQRAQKAVTEGLFQEEIIAVEVPQRKGEPIIVSDDEEPGRGDIAKLAKLRTAFQKDGKATAGNASIISDGAAAVVVMSKDRARELGCDIMATIGAQASAGLDMKYVLVAPILAIPKVLQKEGISQDAIDLFEINEAFSGSTVAVLRELNLDPAIVNVNGGSVALGHPIGASGCRVLVTLLYEMIKQNKKTGLASLCLGGGEAVAMIVKR
jgi:acetyl-CoA C-acetyltransferase